MAKIIAYSPNGQAYQCDSMAEAKQVQGGFKFKRKVKKRNGGCGCGGACGNPHCGPKRRNPVGATLSEDYNMAVFAGAVEHGKLPPKDASAEYKKGYAEGAKIAKQNKLALAAAMGAFRTTGSQKRAGQMLREMAGKSPTSPVGNPRKRRNPVGADPRYVPVTMNPKPKGKYLAHEKEEEQIFASMLAKLPVGVTMQAGKHRVRKLSKGYVVIDGERLGMKDAAAKLHGR